MTTTTDSTQDRLDRLEAMLVGLGDQLERLSEQLQLPLSLQARTLRRLEDSLDTVKDELSRVVAPRLPPPIRLERPAEEA